MAIDALEESLCNGCGVCYSICPQDVFRMVERTGKVAIQYPADCVACWSCELFCPSKCIKVSEPRPRKMPRSDTLRQNGIASR